MQKSTNPEFNFCIATHWPNSDRLRVYTIHSSEIHYGDQQQAQRTLEYVQSKAPDEQWRIVPITVYPDKVDI
jgi:hypothetical protein